MSFEDIILNKVILFLKIYIRVCHTSWSMEYYLFYLFYYLKTDNMKTLAKIPWNGRGTQKLHKRPQEMHIVYGLPVPRLEKQHCCPFHTLLKAEPNRNLHS